jgi:hypothetical protein
MRYQYYPHQLALHTLLEEKDSWTCSTIPTMITAANSPALCSMTKAHLFSPDKEASSSKAACEVPRLLIRLAAGDEAVMATGETRLAFRR